ncbi:phosphoribosylamine--glycine ligase [Clostridiales bacterium COT073_COT-073]|nr:phosphoribosylamine--glycine ligase [Clostridiales bacterium COT073_COT-073]
MKYLVIGNGARESAILWKLRQDEPEAVLYCLPGNGGTARIAENVPISPGNQEAVADFAEKNKIDLTIVGPEQPLVEGIVDIFRQRGLAIIGPDKATAQLEGSKAFAKDFMKKYRIPTADYAVYGSAEAAQTALENWKYPFVIKADGLAAGKGVLIVENEAEAVDGLNQIMMAKKFGTAGDKVVFEEFLSGIEASLICFVDGHTILPMESARDYKRAYDGDKGLNTGGMGCFSPNPILSDKAIEAEIKEQILNPVLAGIQAENMDFRGILFIGLMLTETGVKVLEFNVRLGDPETEVLLPRLKTPLVQVLWAVYQQKLSEIKLEWSSEACVGVVLAAAGYPEDYETGKAIKIADELKDEMIFYGGTVGTAEHLLTAGGRVMVTAALGKTRAAARKKAYQIAETICFEGKWFRRDIADIED